jgi:hypothetical protein
MRRLGLVALVALVLVPAAEAKFRLRMILSDGHPTVAQTVLVTLRADPVQPADAKLELVAVPPGVKLYPALRSKSRYRVPVVRDAPAWRATVRFSRPGRWLLVVPNWGRSGYAIPPPIVRLVRVTRG